MRIPRAALFASASIFLVLAFLFSVSSAYTFSTTGRVSLQSNVTTFSLSVFAVAAIAVFAYWEPYEDKSKPRRRTGGGDDDGDEDVYFPPGDRNFEQIKRLSGYSMYRRANPGRIVKEMRTYIREMRDNPDYFNTLPKDVQKELNTIYFGHSDRKSASLHLRHLRTKLTDMYASYT